MARAFPPTAYGTISGEASECGVEASQQISKQTNKQRPGRRRADIKLPWKIRIAWHCLPHNTQSLFWSAFFLLCSLVSSKNWFFRWISKRQVYSDYSVKSCVLSQFLLLIALCLVLMCQAFEYYNLLHGSFFMPMEILLFNWKTKQKKHCFLVQDEYRWISIEKLGYKWEFLIKSNKRNTLQEFHFKFPPSLRA